MLDLAGTCAVESKLMHLSLFQDPNVSMTVSSKKAVILVVTYDMQRFVSHACCQEAIDSTTV